MEDIVAMVEDPSTSEITTFDQIDQNLFKRFLTKTCAWDFYEMSREKFEQGLYSKTVFNFKIL